MKISTLGEFVEAVSKIKRNSVTGGSTKPIWFRGHSDIGWELKPSLYRGSHDPEYEREMIRDFKLNLHNFYEKVPEREIEILFIMQHYGCPTRLMDWTESSLVALFFAVYNTVDADACVWFLFPWSLNELFLDANLTSVPEITHDKVKDYELNNYKADVINRRIVGEYPVAIRPPRRTPRILAQRGVFTIHGCKTDSFQDIMLKNNGLKIDKIDIERDSKKSIMRDLMDSGITHSVLFPEIAGLASEVNYKFSKSFFDY
jgi:hypothetical protein